MQTTYTEPASSAPYWSTSLGRFDVGYCQIDKNGSMERKMKKILAIAVVLWFVATVYAVENKVNAVHGTITSIDSSAKTLVIKTSNGVEHTLHYVEKTTVHGADKSADNAKDSWRGLKADTEVVAHYTERGTHKTALEIDKVGKDGLKTTDGTIEELDKSGKKLVVKTSNGVEEEFRLTENAAKDAGTYISENLAKGKKAIVYYTEEANKKIAHFFE